MQLAQTCQPRTLAPATSQQSSCNVLQPSGCLPSCPLVRSAFLCNAYLKQRRRAPLCSARSGFKSAAVPSSSAGLALSSIDEDGSLRHPASLGAESGRSAAGDGLEGSVTASPPATGSSSCQSWDGGSRGSALHDAGLASSSSTGSSSGNSNGSRGSSSADGVSNNTLAFAESNLSASSQCGSGADSGWSSGSNMLPQPILPNIAAVDTDSTNTAVKGRRRADVLSSVDVYVDPKAVGSEAFTEEVETYLRNVNWPRVWALVLFIIAYIHQATTGFALPAMLPMISTELMLSDMQGALLTTGYSYLYALALVPLGLLADRMSRPKLLAGGLALWSFLTILASFCKDYTQLITARVGFAAAQATQNPICFGLIQELFPRSRSTALALYNCAIYVGRALSFGAVLLARHLHDEERMDLSAQLDKLDLQSMSVMFSRGDMAAATPTSLWNDHADFWYVWDHLPDSSWRQVLRWIALPGFAIAAAVLLTLREPREEQSAAAASAARQKEAASSAVAAASAAGPMSPAAATAVAAAAAAAAAVAADGSVMDSAEIIMNSGTMEAMGIAAAASATVAGVAAAQAAGPMMGAQGEEVDQWGELLKLLRNRAFMSTTLAAALNDVGSYALIAWQSTFYERVHGLSPAVYAPMLAMVLPVGGIIGGVGGGYVADLLSRKGGRVWITAGASLLAAPFLAQSFLAGDYHASFAALLVGFGLSEAWRAPAAVMARSIAPESLGSSASALYLCIRNLVGGLGPLAVAGLSSGGASLQHAMMIVPASYIGSGLLFALADRWFVQEMAGRSSSEGGAVPMPVGGQTGVGTSMDS